MSTPLQARIAAPGPKKILACDGGGIRGLMSVEILAALEAQLRRELQRPTLVLADWFDFVCGTSTGAIIATCISAGMSMDQIRRFYVDNGAQMFDEASVLKRLHYRFNDEPLARMLQQALDQALGHRASMTQPHAPLGSPGLRTVLMMVLRNHNTDSPWPVWNNPHAKYNHRARPDCNLDLPLWQLVRASTAAPTFFPPEVVSFGEGTEKEYRFVFVDGGVTTYNNPAFLAFQMATAEPYKLGWATGVDKMLVVSVGTGSAARTWEGSPLAMTALHHALAIPDALMNAAGAGWDMACRVLGECRHGESLDNEVGSMVAPDCGPANWTGPKQFAYVRYNPELTAEGLAGLGLPDVKAEHVRALDSVAHIADLQRVGSAYARLHVDAARQLRGFLG
jgi:predicted acylesterase/phospholipase RssA